jgi:hypothetical protein
MLLQNLIKKAKVQRRKTHLKHVLKFNRNYACAKFLVRKQIEEWIFSFLQLEEEEFTKEHSLQFL